MTFSIKFVLLASLEENSLRHERQTNEAKNGHAKLRNEDTSVGPTGIQGAIRVDEQVDNERTKSIRNSGGGSEDTSEL